MAVPVVAPKLMKLNLNQTIYVTLKPKGLAALIEYTQTVYGTLDVIDPYLNGLVWETQFHKLMRVFGPYCSEGQVLHDYIGMTVEVRI